MIVQIWITEGEEKNERELTLTMERSLPAMRNRKHIRTEGSKDNGCADDIRKQ